MSSRPRIAVWYLVLPAATLVFGLLIGDGLRTSNPASLGAAPARVEVTRVIERPVEVTRIADRTVVVTRVTEKPPVEVTRVIEVVVTATPRPAAVPTPATAAKPAAPPTDKVFRSGAWATEAGEAWVGQGMAISIIGPVPHNNSYVGTQVSFAVLNRTGAALNFEARPQVYLEFNTGKRYMADDKLLTYNDWKSGDKVAFTMEFSNLSWGDFQAAKRNNEVLFYTVGIKDFHPRLPEARWRSEEIMH